MRGKYGGKTSKLSESAAPEQRRFPARLNVYTFTIGENDMTDRKSTTSYKEVKIGNTLYRVTSVFTGEKDLGKTLEQLAIRRAMAELTSCPARN